MSNAFYSHLVNVYRKVNSDMTKRGVRHKIERLRKLQKDFEEMTLEYRRANPNLWREIVELEREIKKEILNTKDV